MKTKLIFTIIFSLCVLVGFAQQPFAEYGYKVKVATLSKGKYIEFFDQDSLVEIGSVVLNRLTGKLTYFIAYDTTYSEATLKPDLISRWISQDPLAEEYYDFSPYNFVLNNPIKFTDPDGTTVIGADGKPVTYDKDKEGNINWSENATDDIKKLGGAMLMTDMGTSALNDMIAMDTELTLKIDAGEGDGGGYAQTDALKDENGNPVLTENGTLKAATITVYEGALKKDQAEGNQKYSDATTNEFFNATGVHEREHLKPGQIQKDYNYTAKSYKDYITNQEGGPLTAEYLARKQYRSIYGGSDDWKRHDIRNGINPEKLPMPKKKKN
jgi:hypothetical protein